MGRSKYGRNFYGRIAAVIRAYPERRFILNDMKSMSGNSGNEGRSIGKISRTTEDLALRTLPERQQKELEAVEHAIRTILCKPYGRATVNLIDLVYFKRKYTLREAGERLGYSYDGAKILRRRFFILVAKYLGMCP